MTPSEFVANALRTESKKEVIYGNADVIHNTIDAIVALSEILDQVKKHAFYKKPFDIPKIDAAIDTARRCVAVLHHSRPNFPMPSTERKLDIDPRIFHSIIGIATESSELLEAMRHNDIDRVNIMEEFGDLNWYEAIGVDAIDTTFEEVLERVIAKLRARYPEKFTNENAINRDLDKERQVLEGKE